MQRLGQVQAMLTASGYGGSVEEWIRNCPDSRKAGTNKKAKAEKGGKAKKGEVGVGFRG